MIHCSPVRSSVLVILIAALFVGGAGAQTFTNLPAGFEVVTLPGSYILPVGITFAPDGRLFVLEKPGTVRIVSDQGIQQPSPFIDLVAEVNNDWDRGLLGIALHPGFVPDGGATSWVYLLYTVSPVPPNDNGFNQSQKYSFSRLTRWRAISSGPSVVADLSSRQVLLGNQLPDGSVPDGIASLHNSHSNGSVVFGADGTLLLSTGDGAHYDFQDNGNADAPGFDDWVHLVTGLLGPTPVVQDEGAFRSRDPRSLAGKILRLDPATGFGLPSNPLYDGDIASHASRVWALGLRNPFRMQRVPGTGASNPALGQPGVLVASDVGWNVWEELNVSRFGGEDFGWPCFEGVPANNGYQNFNASDPGQVDCGTPSAGVITAPAVAWHHSSNASYFPPGLYVDEGGSPLTGFRGSCAVVGPAYTGNTYPAIYQGRVFFSDYVRNWLKTIEFGPNFEVLAIKPFASNTGQIVDMASHPISGEIYLLGLSGGVIHRLQHGANLTPLAQASAQPSFGPAPLSVQFTGSTSSDPDGDPLTYFWNFGDGSTSSLPDPGHVYVANGLYTANLTVTDTGGLWDGTEVVVAVGNQPPTATILSPLQGELFTPPFLLQMSGTGSDPEGQPLSYAWSVDLYHDIHVHPGSFLASGTTASLPVEVSPEDDELLYYRVQLTVTDAGGLSASDEAFVLPTNNRRNVSGTALPISRMDELSPPNPTGGGNHDIEVLRDGVLPPVGSADSLTQYDSYHGGAQGSDDWIGVAFPAPPGDEFRFTSVAFQEGKHFVDGGWWQSLAVEVRNGGVWGVVPDVQINPPYPFAFSGTQFFDGINFQSYELRFSPVFGDALRLRGDPGGSAGFLSAGELSVYGIGAVPHDGFSDITAQGTVVGRVFELSPSGPIGSGNKNPLTIRNGTWPPLGSQSFHAQFDTFLAGAQGNDDWIGYTFPGPRSFGRVRFQEGRNNVDGGAFESLGVEVQSTPGGAWLPVSGLTITPPYDGLDGVHYETFVLQFPPVSGHGIRLRGDPAGSNSFISVGELAVDTPAPEGCGVVPYGLPTGSNLLSLGSFTPPILGQPFELTADGATGPASGWLGLSPSSASLAIKGGTLHLDPQSLLLLDVLFDSNGQLALATTLPTDVGLVGASVRCQVFAAGQPGAFVVLMSNGLTVTLCAP